MIAMKSLQSLRAALKPPTRQIRPVGLGLLARPTCRQRLGWSKLGCPSFHWTYFSPHIDCALRRERRAFLTSKINNRHFFHCPLSRRWRQVGGPRRVSPTIFPPTSDRRDPLGRPVANGRAKCKEIGWSLWGHCIFLVIFARIAGF